MSDWGPAGPKEESRICLFGKNSNVAKFVFWSDCQCTVVWFLKWLASKAWICLTKLLRAAICTLQWWLSYLYVHNINLLMQNFYCKPKHKLNNTPFFGVSILINDYFHSINHEHNYIIISNHSYFLGCLYDESFEPLFP